MANVVPPFERTAIPNGPRVISARVPGCRSMSAAVYVLAGSRLERPTQAGVAHFMEHVTFKGTHAFPTTRAVSEAIEGYGGSSNAATDRESTVYWARVPMRESDRAFDMLAELTVRPLLRTEDSVRGLTDEDIREFWSHAYKPSNLVVAAAGDMDHSALVEQVKTLFGTGS